MPRFSIFTPTHRPDFLLQAYHSLLAQTEHDWQWVIVPNGEALPTIPAAISDARVLVSPFVTVGQPKIGALKRFAASECIGDILVELDHDDLLEPLALAFIDAEVNRGAGFVYSDFANFREDRSCEVYDAKWGWQTYPYRDYIAHRAFATTPAALSAIFFTPNHVRAWTRAAYDQAGGHDAGLAVCDDYDLVCRTYLAGVSFAHVPECLYLYRLHANGSNTYLERNAEIQTKQLAIADKYRQRIVGEWCRREGLPKYDLGGGLNPCPGYRSLDTRSAADLQCDARKGLPFADNSVGAFRAYDFLEHIPHCRDSSCAHTHAEGCTVFVVNEIYRALVPGGWLLTGTPSTDGRGAFQDPTHCSFWNVPNSWWYYTRAEQAKYIQGSAARFQMVRCWNAFPSDWHKLHNIVYGYAELCALKGQRQPGLCEI